MKKGKYQSKGASRGLAVLLALVLVLGCTIGGTIAWLTSTTETVTNTFTVGDINISLAETTNTYKIVPGGTSAKDPKITVQQGSEKCYVYVCVENNVKLNGTVVATPNIDTTNWTVVATSGNKTLYRYKEIVDAGSAAQELPVFTQVSYSADILKSDMSDLDGKTIVVQGYAHQSDNTTQAVADAAAKTNFDFSTT